MFSSNYSEKDHIDGGRNNKAVNRKRNKRDAFNQLQEGFDRHQRHDKRCHETDCKHRNI